MLTKFMCGLVLMFMAWGVNAQVFRLDDSASPRQRIMAPTVLSENGIALAADRNAQFALLQFGKVQFNLATHAYKGRNAHIYYVIPASLSALQSPSALQVQWRSLGSFASGTAQSGSRTLVWTGRLLHDTLQETLDLSARLRLADTRLPYDGHFGFDSYFEIELLP